jgi:septum formation protein
MEISNSFVLASGSPRRAFLLKECGFQFIVQPTDAPEDFEDDMEVELVPAFLATKKAEAALLSAKSDQLILTADTIVIFNGAILNKPQSTHEAIEMLSLLSGNTHKVITAVCLATQSRMETIEETSWVTFRDLDMADIEKYVHQFKPMDKAGAYGAQECLPENYDPLSGHEKAFLQRIKNTTILQKSKPEPGALRPMIAIQEIAGSYFNVMGLPIAKIYDRLLALTKPC